MTDHPDQPAPDTAPRTPVTDLLALLGQIPADHAAQLRGIGIAVHRCRPDVPWFLDLPVATPQAGQALADRLGLPRYDNTPYQHTDPQTRWSGPWAHYQHVQVTHDAWENDPPPGPQDARALTGHLNRLDQALTALQNTHDVSDLYQATVTARGLRLQTHTDHAARTLAAHLCPQTPGRPHTIPLTTPTFHTTAWETTTPDTTITGPWALTHTHDTDTDEDLP